MIVILVTHITLAKSRRLLLLPFQQEILWNNKLRNSKVEGIQELSSRSSIVTVCVNVCVCTWNMQICYMFMYAFIHVCSYSWVHGDKRRALGVSLYHPISQSLETTPLSEPGAKLAASKPQWTSCQCLSFRLMWTFITDFFGEYLDPNLEPQAV